MLSAALSWFDRRRPAPKHADERALPADAFTPPNAEATQAGRWEAPSHDTATVSLALDNREAVVTPTGPAHYPATNPAHVAGGYADGGPVTAREPIVAGQFDRDLAATKRQDDWPEPPDYGRPPTSVGQITVAMDREIAGSLATARGESLALERRLRLVAEQRYAVAEAARVKAVARVAELELTVRSLGKVIAHAAGHDKGGSGEEGGE